MPQYLLHSADVNELRRRRFLRDAAAHDEMFMYVRATQNPSRADACEIPGDELSAIETFIQIAPFSL